MTWELYILRPETTGYPGYAVWRPEGSGWDATNVGTSTDLEVVIVTWNGHDQRFKGKARIYLDLGMGIRFHKHEVYPAEMIGKRKELVLPREQTLIAIANMMRHGPEALMAQALL